MSNELVLIEPGRANNVDQKQGMLKYVKDSRALLKAAGYSDRFVENIKVVDLQRANERATNKITLKNFEKLVEDDIKKQSWISKFFNKLKNKLTISLDGRKSRDGYTRW